MPARRVVALALLALGAALGPGAAASAKQVAASGEAGVVEVEDPVAEASGVEPPDGSAEASGVEPPDGSAEASGVEPPDARVESGGAEPPGRKAGAGLDVYDPLFDDHEHVDDPIDHDPLEPANRWTFAFNERVNRWVLDPVTEGYQWVVPEPARRGLGRIFRNLNAPVIFANEVLQLRPVPAATTASRFVVNSTLGIAGIFDVADDVMGMPAGAADFGQTLARYGVPRGPYLVVPLFGPSTARDAFGTIADQMLDPLTYLMGPLNFQWQLLRGSEGLVLRDENLDSLDALRESSVDFYSALRSAYLQSRRAMEIEAAGGPDPTPASADPLDQDSLPEASFSMRSSIAAISPAKSSRLTIPENSERRSASSLTVPSR